MAAAVEKITKREYQMPHLSSPVSRSALFSCSHSPARCVRSEGIQYLAPFIFYLISSGDIVVRELHLCHNCAGKEAQSYSSEQQFMQL